MKTFLRVTPFLTVLVGLMAAAEVYAVPGMINYQGKVEVNGLPFTGTGQFRFAIVDESGTVQYWSNDGNDPPTTDVLVSVSGGIYSVLLGDTGIMGDSIPASVFDNEDVFLRVWFNDGISGLELLSDDQRLASVPFAFRAASSPYFGAWETRAEEVDYLASTDGFIATASSPGNSTVGYTDSSSHPTTVRASNGGNALYNGFCMPVRKGDYWRVEDEGAPQYVYWISLRP